MARIRQILFQQKLRSLLKKCATIRLFKKRFDISYYLSQD
jgi:hypothetical protein